MLAQRLFRDILGQFTTGVVLVTAQTPKGPVGLSVNSFTSVALEPPLVAWCAAVTSTTWPSIRAAGGFAVTILGGQHERLCRVFSRKGADRFAGGTWTHTRTGHPILTDGLGWLDCRIMTVYRAGDHDLVIAEAIGGEVAGKGDPLIFHAGRLTVLES